MRPKSISAVVAIVCGLNFLATCAVLAVDLSASPAVIRYPFHTAPGGTVDTLITLVGNDTLDTPYTFAINFLSGSGWLAFGGSQGPAPSGTVSGTTQSEHIGLSATGPATQGLYRAEVNFTYDGGNKILKVEIDLYNFTKWALPKDVSIRTALARLNVNQASQIAHHTPGSMFSYFADSSDYLFDGYLILGNSAENMSYSTFGAGRPTAGMPTASNPYGFLYAASDSMISDSTHFGGNRYATGFGYNRDSTLAFIADYWAPKHADSANFFVLRYLIYHGPKDTGSTISNITIAYYADFDVPSDTAAQNLAGWDTTATGTTRRIALYQQGTSPSGSSDNGNRFGALGGASHLGFAPIGGFVVDNESFLYPNGALENDSLWNRLEAIPALAPNSGGTYSVDAAYASPGGTPKDLSMVLLFQRGATIRSAGRRDTLKATVIVACTPSTGSLTMLKNTMNRAYKFVRTNKLRFCRCGDADGNGAVSISDAVHVIRYIFQGGPASNPICRADADGNGAMSISDAVKLINNIFAGGMGPEKC